MSSLNKFPVIGVIGCRFEGHESGGDTEGTITAVKVEANYISFYADHDDVFSAFAFNPEWGSWHQKDDEVEVSIPMVGSFVIYDVRQQ